MKLQRYTLRVAYPTPQNQEIGRRLVVEESDDGGWLKHSDVINLLQRIGFQYEESDLITELEEEEKE